MLIISFLSQGYSFLGIPDKTLGTWPQDKLKNLFLIHNCLRIFIKAACRNTDAVTHEFI